MTAPAKMPGYPAETMMNPEIPMPASFPSWYVAMNAWNVKAGRRVYECPCHDWMFDLQTGDFVTAGQLKIPRYESKVEEHKIYVKIQGAP